MYVQKAIYLLPILIISISFICAVVLAIVFCLKKKAKYLFMVASAFIIVSVLSCIAIKFTPPAKAPENEPAVLNRLTPENLRYTKDYFDHYMSNADEEKMPSDKSKAKLSDFDYSYSSVMDSFNLAFTVLSGDKFIRKTVYEQQVEYSANNVFMNGSYTPRNISPEQYESLPSVSEFETITKYLSTIRFSEILPEDYSTLSIVYKSDTKLSSLENADGYYILDSAGFNSIDRSELSPETKYVDILIAVDNRVYAVYAVC